VGICEFACPPHETGILKPIDIVGSSRALIYCNFISLQFVGGELIRCLRTFTFPTDYCYHTYEDIYYVPVE
jgi:hypothetical protein